MGTSSPLVLSLSTVFALLGIVLVAIAFGTNNWQEVGVKREMLKQAYIADARTKASIEGFVTDGNGDLFFQQNVLAYDRQYGLFRECFPGQNIPQVKYYTSPLGASCRNRGADYQIPEDSFMTSQYSEQETTKLHLMRTQVAFYIVGLAILFVCLFTGVAGCWRRSSGLILATGICLLFATLFLAGSMAIWHGVDYLSREVIEVYPYYRTWPQALKHVTSFSYGWSYMLSWIGIGFVLIASILMLLAYRAMKNEEHVEMMMKHGGGVPYVMTPPGGGGGNAYYDKQPGMMHPYAATAGQYGTYGYAGYPASQYGGGGNYAQAAVAQGGYGQNYGYLTYNR